MISALRQVVTIATMLALRGPAESVERTMDDGGLSMLLMKGTKVQLVTREMALNLAKALIVNSFGQHELELQNPLIITESGDNWVINGSRKFVLPAIRDTKLIDGKVTIIISKLDCQILQFTMQGKFAPPELVPQEPGGQP